MRALLLCGFLVSAPALAIKKGDALYVSAKEVTLRAQPKDKAAKVEKLRAGDEVTWQGASDKDARFQSVTTAQGKKGFLLTTELTPNRPQRELTVSGQFISADAFAASGAAVTKCTYGPPPPTSQHPEVDAQLAAAEAINRAAATPEALAKKQQELNR